MSMIHIAGPNSTSTLTNLDDVMVSPNAIDLRLKKVFEIQHDVFVIDEEHKKHRTTKEVHADIDGYFNLKPGKYEVVMENEVTIAEGEAGWVVTRSTLNRNGVYITSGLYDSGYSGVVAGVLHINLGPMKVKIGTRIGQFLLFKAEALHSYDGDYGSGKAHDEKYK